jgi:hypothetical protein
VNICVFVFFEVGMEATFKPVSRLIELLGPKPTHPWGALIPQVLLWSFRRFCIEKLVQACNTPLTDQMWDDYLELVSVYAPKGLNTIAVDWIIPENIGFVSSSLEEYNRFFIEFLDIVDHVLKVDDNDTQDAVSNFLDSTMGDIIEGWLSGDYRVFLIYPMDEAAENQFTDEQCSKLINALITFEKSNTPASHTTDLPLPELPVYTEKPHEDIITTEAVDAPSEPPEQEFIQQIVRPMLRRRYQPDPQPQPEPQPEPEPEPQPQPEPELPTAKEALKRRKTRRAILREGTRGKTRRTHPSL